MLNNAENVHLMEEIVVAIEINPKDTTREMAFDLWMKSPNPMVTFFKTLDVTNLVKLSKKKKLKFIRKMCKTVHITVLIKLKKWRCYSKLIRQIIDGGIFNDSIFLGRARIL